MKSRGNEKTLLESGDWHNIQQRAQMPWQQTVVVAKLVIPGQTNKEAHSNPTQQAPAE